MVAGLTEVDTHEHWIEIETVDQTPDTKVHYLDQSAGYNHRKIYNVEVVDWETHIDDPMQVIRQKCAGAYPPYFFLLVFGRSGIEKVVEARTLLEEVQHLRVPFGEVWIIGHVSDSGYRMLKLAGWPTLSLAGSGSGAAPPVAVFDGWVPRISRSCALNRHVPHPS